MSENARLTKRRGTESYYNLNCYWLKKKMSNARSNLFDFTDKRLMKKTIGNITDPSHSAACCNRLLHTSAVLLLTGLVLGFLVVAGPNGWSVLCFLALLFCCPGACAISTSPGPGSSESGHQPCLVIFRLRSVYREQDFTIDALKYYDPEFTRDIDFQIADYCN